MNYHTLLHSPIVSSKTVPLIDQGPENNASVLIWEKREREKSCSRKIIHHTGESESHFFYRWTCTVPEGAAFEEEISRLARGP